MALALEAIPTPLLFSAMIYVHFIQKLENIKVIKNKPVKSYGLSLVSPHVFMFPKNKSNLTINIIIIIE